MTFFFLDFFFNIPRRTKKKEIKKVSKFKETEMKHYTEFGNKITD